MRLMSIGDAARASGLSGEALRLYDEKGLSAARLRSTRSRATGGTPPRSSTGPAWSRGCGWPGCRWRGSGWWPTWPAARAAPRPPS